jgi:3-hydroxyisobutyrate dehydrogenase-like beta-hydroxyacid dehydrogenase
MKLINNFIAMGYAALFSEALGIARKAGLSTEQFHSVIGSSRMRNGFYDTFMKWTMEGDHNAHRFTISNAHKDMRYLSSLANEIGALHPIQSMVKNSFAGMEAAGQAERYVPMLADFVATLNGLPPSHPA